MSRRNGSDTKMAGNAKGLAVVVAILGLCACTVRPRISDTGYAGTWARGNSRVTSVIAIAKIGDAYRFRWGKRSVEGHLDVRCGWNGRCDEFLVGKLVATHEFRAYVHPDTGRLMVECFERRLEPERRDLHYVDELVVEGGGRLLRAYTVERDGQTFSGGGRPTRVFDKVADAVAGDPGTAVR